MIDQHLEIMMKVISFTLFFFKKYSFKEIEIKL